MLQARHSLAEAFVLVFRCGLLLFVYAYTYQAKGGNIAGQQYEVIAWSMFIYFMFSSMKLRRITPVLIQDIQSGNIEMLINRPIPYIRYRMLYQIATGFVPVICVVPAAIVLMGLSVGLPPIMYSSIFWWTLPVVLMGCITLSLLVYSILGLIAFWIEEPTPLFWIADKSVMILGGSFLPVAFFPPLMKILAIYSPFGACLLLTHMTSDTWTGEALKLIGIQWAWITLLFTVLLWLNQKAHKKLSVNGG
ncbi:hypothetical protein OPIT5_21280 [Opitutaceae bacterium TAV5]|nr:hypothetical protein OPIT5_21280 [Opitutaceae bacterium TAV5]